MTKVVTDRPHNTFQQVRRTPTANRKRGRERKTGNQFSKGIALYFLIKKLPFSCSFRIVQTRIALLFSRHHNINFFEAFSDRKDLKKTKDKDNKPQTRGPFIFSELNLARTFANQRQQPICQNFQTFTDQRKRATGWGERHQSKSRSLPFCNLTRW